jgi:hypothetical protein
MSQYVPIRVGVEALDVFENAIRADERAKIKLAMGDDGEHRLSVGADSWFISHPIDCRIMGMEQCPIRQAVMKRPPCFYQESFKSEWIAPGLYKVSIDQNGEYSLNKSEGGAK